MATPTDNVVGLSGNSLIDGLVQGSAWQFSGSHILTYSFSIYDPPSGGTWNSALSNAMRGAFSAWANVAQIAFVEAGSGTDFRQSTADIAIVLTGNDLQSNFGAAGLGVLPSPSFADNFIASLEDTRLSYPRPEGDIGLDHFSSAFNYLNAGGVGFTIMLHELGHALGLKHTKDDGGNGRPTFAALGISNLDSNRYTVMSYTDVNGHQLGNDVLGNAATPMPLDILAIQRIYGANTAYHTRDDTYTLYGPWPAMTSTIWDAGGNDTLAAGSVNQFNNVTLDLREGQYSKSPTISGVSIAIAYNVTIENAVGGDGNDTLIGNGANNRLDGGLGADTMSGGAGNDTYIVDNANDGIVEQADEGVDLVQSSATFSLPNNVENLVLTGSSAISATGNALDNILTGNSMNNILDGGDGIDTASYATAVAGVTVTLALSTAQNTVGAGTDSLLAIENLAGSGFNDTLTGNALNNILTGNNGNDTLDGGPGNDTMIGGTGDDTYHVNSTADVVTENPAEGTDQIQSSVSYTLPDNVENLMLTGAGNINGTGNDLDNQIIGNTGGNVLGGGAGTDTLIGGAGDDLYYLGGASDDFYDVQARDVIVEAPGEGTDYVFFTNVPGVLAANVEYGFSLGTSSTLTGNTGDNVLIGGYASVAQTLNGGDGNDFLSGTAAPDTLNGGAGADTLLGRGGGDQLIGGDGSDNYYVESLADVVTEAAGAPAGATDIIYANVNVTLADNVEYLFTYGAATNVTGNALDNALLAVYSPQGVTLNGGGGNNILYGSGFADTLNGNAGNDTLFGSAGGADGAADQMAGGLGNNLYFVQELADTVSESAGEGTDTVYAAINHTLGANLETLFIYGAATSGTGNNDANTLIGSYINSGVTLDGAGGNDLIIGGGGNDTLIGGTGNDTLTGAGGLDTFRFDTLPNAATNLDTITDFSVADDTIQLENAIFTALTATGALAADMFISGAGVTAAADANNFLIYNSSTGALYYDADGTGAAATVQFATLSAGLALTAGDFVVS